MTDGRPSSPDNSSPPLIDLTSRPEPTPGPLTKPSPTIKPQKGPRWRILLIAVLVLAAAAAAIAFLPPLFA
ncbi:hypothetical protein ACSS7Z_02310 [Microbacterium sp. A82]|uniref:hypothetical protein n=1 Tax=unclassified Microbacterium TaxID=2609290 RepID=UPI003F2E6B5D